jgi:hypothetical protein
VQEVPAAERRACASAELRGLVLALGSAVFDQSYVAYTSTDRTLDIHLPTSHALLAMLLNNILVSDPPLDLRLLLDVFRHNDRLLREVIRVAHPLDSNNIQEDNPHKVAHELEDQLANVRTAVAVDDEAEHHAEGGHAAEDASHACETLRVVCESGDYVLGCDLVDAVVVSLVCGRPMRHYGRGG